MKRILRRLKVAILVPFLMVRYAFSPAFRRLIRMHESRKKRMEDFVTRKVRELAERGDPKYQAMLSDASRPVNRRGHKTIGDIYDAGAWKCENCGRTNAWGTPTCRCRHKR